ncbi:SA1002 family membrane protein [Rothia sp. P5766]|uniref:SA1002 family membrane protein n=1 Tax=unclassified Rothia (in: high G+C Gram-positive bacteria) TaxID=2689056 RepID=UPI003AC183CC
MTFVIQLIVLLSLLYLVGRLSNPKKFRDSNDDYSFITVLAHMLIILVTSALILSGQIIILLAGLALYTWCTQDPAAPVPLEDDMLNVGFSSYKFDGGNFLLGIAILILITAIVHFWVRAKFFERFPRHSPDMKEIEISEYFIQWLTIYLAVYQFIFDGLKNAFSFVDTPENTAAFFNIALTPQNINLVLQPLLIASWITLVISKIRLQRKHEADL